MVISVIGPEGAGKTSFTKILVKQVGFNRPVFFIGPKSSEWPKISLKDIDSKRNAVIIIDDANAVLESYEVYEKDLNIKGPFVLHRERNVLIICVFHSFDDAVKYFFRQSRFIYVSCMYRDASYTDNKYIKGITPTLNGHKKFPFWGYKRF